MRSRKNPRSPLQARAFYSITALARIGNVNTYTLRCLLRANGVTLLRAQRVLFVPVTEIQAKIPPLWESICLVAELRGEPMRDEVC